MKHQRQSPALCPDGAVAGKLRHQGRQATRGGAAVGRAAARRRRRSMASPQWHGPARGRSEAAPEVESTSISFLGTLFYV